jgi:hypothetical protein
MTMFPRLVLIALVAALAASCKSKTPTVEEPGGSEAASAEAEQANAQTAGTGDAAPTARSLESSPECEQAAARLTAPLGRDAGDVDLDEARRIIEGVETARAPEAIRALASAGPAGAPLVEALEMRLLGDDLPTNAAIFDTLAAVDPPAALAAAEGRAADSTRTVADRTVATVALARMGKPGLEALSRLHESSETETSREIAMRGMASAASYPLAAREVLFAPTGFCMRYATHPDCLEAARLLMLAWPELPTQSGPVYTLLLEERAASLRGYGGNEWFGKLEPALIADANAAAASLLRLDALGPAAGLEMAGIAAIRTYATTDDLRRRLGAWLARRWMTLDGAGSRLGPILEHAGDISLPFLGIAYVVSGADDVPSRALSAMADFAGSSRTAIGQLTDLAVARARGRGAIAGDDPSLPAEYSRVRAAVAGEDVGALVEVLLDAAVPLPLAIDGALIGASGRHQAFTTALESEEIEGSARALEIAARGAIPSPALVEKLAPFIADSSNHRDIAEWLVAGGAHDHVILFASEALGSASPVDRAAAIRWANLAHAPLERDALLAVLTAPPASSELEPRETRELALFRILAGELPTIDEAISLFDSVERGRPGATETAILLAATHAAHCPAQ